MRTYAWTVAGGRFERVELDGIQMPRSGSIDASKRSKRTRGISSPR